MLSSCWPQKKKVVLLYSHTHNDSDLATMDPSWGADLQGYVGLEDCMDEKICGGGFPVAPKQSHQYM